MKNIYRTLLTLAFCVATLASQAQTIRIANNNANAPGGENVYTTLQAAIDSAADGDIIHVIPSGTTYGTVTIDKALTLYGIGFNPDKDGAAKSIITNIYLSGAGASNVRLSGLVVTTRIYTAYTSGTYSQSNIIIENCRVSYITHNYTSVTVGPLIVRNCIIGSGISSTSGRAISMADGKSSGVVVTNNVILGSTSGSYGAIELDGGAAIENNLFLGSGGTRHAFYILKNCSVKNNIFYGRAPSASSTLTGNTFKNNITFNTHQDTVLATNGNTVSDNIWSEDPLLENMPFVDSYDNTYDLFLQTGSPALGAGENGTDLGPAGGATPFNPFGTSLPLIQTLSAPAVIIQGDSLQVNIKARGN